MWLACAVSTFADQWAFSKLVDTHRLVTSAIPSHARNLDYVLWHHLQQSAQDYHHIFLSPKAVLASSSAHVHNQTDVCNLHSNRRSLFALFSSREVIHKCDYDFIFLFVGASTLRYLVSIHFSPKSHNIISEFPSWLTTTFSKENTGFIFCFSLHTTVVGHTLLLLWARHQLEDSSTLMTHPSHVACPVVAAYNHLIV